MREQKLRMTAPKLFDLSISVYYREDFMGSRVGVGREMRRFLTYFFLIVLIVCLTVT